MGGYLVTGGAGFIGSAVAGRLAGESGTEVVVLDDLSAGYAERLPQAANLRLVEGSILDERKLAAAFEHRPEVVIHMAASFANLRSVQDPIGDLRTNAEGTLRVLQMAVESRTAFFLHASSSCVYGDSAEPLDEATSALKPYTPYAVSKLASEQFVMFFARYHALGAAALRYFNCYGPGERPGPYRGVISNFVQAAIDGRPLVITGSGQETRQFLYVDDAARATVSAARAGERIGGQVMNVASGKDTAMIDLARAILEVTGSASPIVRTRARDWDVVEHRRACTSRARDLLGFAATTGMGEGLAATARAMAHPARGNP